MSDGYSDMMYELEREKVFNTALKIKEHPSSVATDIIELSKAIDRLYNDSRLQLSRTQWLEIERCKDIATKWIVKHGYEANESQDKSAMR